MSTVQSAPLLSNMDLIPTYIPAMCISTLNHNPDNNCKVKYFVPITVLSINLNFNQNHIIVTVQ